MLAQVGQAIHFIEGENVSLKASLCDATHNVQGRSTAVEVSLNKRVLEDSPRDQSVSRFSARGQRRRHASHDLH
jgi:hypothetical protein